jgi:ubiquinone/menaquinone biosynthesis C-methylase UbiE
MDKNIEYSIIEKHNAIVVEEYNKRQHLIMDGGINFRNHGYSPSSKFILEEDFLVKNQISLYLNMFEGIETEEKSILEVGCGPGGGSSAILKYLKIKSIDACDINSLNIEHCKKNHSNLINFKLSDAQNLDYEDNSFDIVINMESSHLYYSPKRFYSEVIRVLKPGGVFLYADCGDVINNFKNYYEMFDKVMRTDITKNVAMACKEDYEKWQKQIKNKEIADFFTNIALRKYLEYSSDPNQYIKYVSYKRIAP